MSEILPINYIDCGRIYIEPIKKNIYLLKCIFCSENYSQWQDFFRHIKDHNNFVEEDVEIKKENCRNFPKVCKEKRNAMNEEFMKELEQSEDDGENTKSSGLKEETEMVLIAEDEDEIAESLADFEVGKSPKTKRKQLNLYSEDSLTNPEIFNSTKTTKEIETIEKTFIPEGSEIENQNCPTKNKEVDLDNWDICSLEPWFSEDNFNDFHSTESKESTSRIVFNVRSSNPFKVLCLIDIIKNYPCLWDLNHPHYGIRSKQMQDYEKVSRELQEKYTIQGTVDEIRASFSDMRSWYQREVRNVKKIPNKVIQHEECFKALEGFLSSVVEKSITCIDCKANFKKESQLASHRYKVHNGPLPFKCGYCEQYFLYQSQKRHHENRHTLGVSYACNECPYKAPNQADLKLHRAKHSDLKPFICDICGASYKKSTSLNVHKRTHGKPKYKCPRCDKHFYEAYRFRIHLQNHKNLVCQFCSKEFATKKFLNKHVLNHYIEMKKKELEKQQENVENGDWCDSMNSNEIADNVDDLIEFLSNENHEEEGDCAEGEDEEDDIDVDVGSVYYFHNDLTCLHCCSDFLTESDLIAHIQQVHQTQN